VSITAIERDRPQDVLAEVEKRFGVLPNFFQVGSETPDIRAKLWGFAQAGYLDNPLPSLFKERLFVRLSRFCEVRYCIARHVGFLVGLGRPAGDSQCPVHTVEDVVQLLQRPFPYGPLLASLFSLCAESNAPLEELPGAGSDMERAVFGLASHVFLQTADAPACLEALKRLLGRVQSEYLLLFLSFIRTAHYWSKVHPELTLEDDVKQLLATHEALAECVLRDPDLRPNETTDKLLDELAFLRLESRQNQQLRDLSNRLLQVQDEERRRMARELHDSTGQILSLLNMNLSQLKRRVPEGRVDLQESAEVCFALATEMTNQLRTVSYLLHPPLLDEIGLSAALKWFIEGFQLRSQISMTADISESIGRLPQELEIALFRIVQEALTNIHRHSGSKRAAIRISCDGASLVLEIEDQGKGISPERLAKVQALGVGIAGMKERLRRFEGVLTIDSSESGTKVTVTLPVPAPKASQPADAIQAKTQTAG
jgi:signal transduction histidine kinase